MPQTVAVSLTWRAASSVLRNAGEAKPGQRARSTKAIPRKAWLGDYLRFRSRKFTTVKGLLRRGLAPDEGKGVSAV